jgi:Leucine Rich repeat
VITKLNLYDVKLVSDPSPDGGLNVLKDFFGRSDTTLTNVTLVYCCNFGSQEDASQLLAAFHTNRTVTDLTIRQIQNLEGGAVLGNSLSGLMQNMSQLQRLLLIDGNLGVEGVRAFQPALQANRTLKELDLSYCQLGDDGLHLLADALVGNAIMEFLNIIYIRITCVGLDNVTRMIESTQLKTIGFGINAGIFNDRDATQRFVSTLQQKKSSVQELPRVKDYFPEHSRDTRYASIHNSLLRNQQLNRVALLLVPPPPLQQQPHATIMMPKISHMAIKNVCHGPQQCWNECDFQTVPSPTGTVGKENQTTTTDCCFCYW